MSTEQKTTKARWLWLLRLVLTIGLIAFILHKTPLGDAWAGVQEADWRWGLAAVACIMTFRGLFALRWHMLLPAIGLKHSPLHSIALGAISYFYTTFTPGTLGGDIARVTLAATGHNISARSLTASLLADRAVGLISILLASLLVLPFIDQPLLRWLLVGLLGAFVAFIAVAIWLSRSGMDPEGSVDRRPTLLWKSVAIIVDMARILVKYRSYPVALAVALLFSFLGIIVTAFSLQCWSLAFGFALGFEQTLVIVVVATITGMVPVTIGQLGWTEGVLMFMLSWAGMGRGEALALVTANRVIATLMSLAGGLLLFFRGSPAAPSEDTDVQS